MRKLILILLLFTATYFSQTETDYFSLPMWKLGSAGLLQPRTDSSALLITGNLGSGWAEPNLGAGSRMLWYPRKSAFRAGGVTATQWDNTNIGDYSFGSGRNTRASGTYSTAMGASSTASGKYSTAIGAGANAFGEFSTAMGYSTKATGNYSTVMGAGTDASGTYSTAMGASTIASGEFSTAMGYGSTASGEYSTAMGYSSRATGFANFSSGSRATASGDSLSFIYGRGWSSDLRATNSTRRSFMVSYSYDDSKVGLHVVDTSYVKMLGTVITDSLTTFYTTTKIDSATIISLPSGKAGWGEVMIGDAQEWATFHFTSAGAVTLRTNSTNVSTTPFDANKLNIYNAGGNVAIQNWISAAQLNVAVKVHYFTP